LLVAAIGGIKKIADARGIQFFLVGASARDLFFSLLFNIRSSRATMDVDLGIQVGSWEEVLSIIGDMEAAGLFTKVPEKMSRYRHMNGTLIDIVPFGSLERPAGKVRWPADDAVMTTTGFDEAFDYAVVLRINNSPIMDVKICTPPAMVILKLIAWDEKYPERTRDAQDIYFITQKYIDAGNEVRLYNEDKDLIEEDGYDYELSSPRLLGRDIGALAHAETYALVMAILDREIMAEADSRLIADMIQGESHHA
jgi:predicted nucleotidyltransferase